MGGKEAELPIEKGTISSLKVIYELPFENNPEYNCNFYD
jgi:hypothetical protein